MVHCPHFTDEDTRARERKGATRRTQVVSSKARICVQVIQPSRAPSETTAEPCSVVTPQPRPPTSAHWALLTEERAIGIRVAKLSKVPVSQK